MKSSFKILKFVFISVLLYGCSKEIENDLTITNVNVINVENGEVLESMDISINKNKISAITNHKSNIQYKGKLVDGTDKYVIPGLFDMHTHIFNNSDPQPPNTWYFPLMLANGVTGVRDMWVKTKEQSEQVTMWRRELETNEFEGPRIMHIGRIVDGEEPINSNFDIISTFNDAKSYVITLKNEGIDFVKVYSKINKEAYDGFIEETQKQGMYVAGHPPLSIPLEYLSNSGMKSIEHVTMHHLYFSGIEDSLRPKLTRNLLDNDALAKAVRTFDEKKFENIVKVLVENKTFISPTIWTSKIDIANLGMDFFEDQEGIPFIPLYEYAEWQHFRDTKPNLSDETNKRNDSIFVHEKFLIKKMYDAGVQLLAATDVGYYYMIPGFSLIDEVIELKDAGISELGAIQTATINPAKYFSATDSLGTIEKNKLADIVILDANPLEDINNLKKTNATIVNGKLYDKETLEKMKMKVLTSNYKSTLKNLPPINPDDIKIDLKKYAGEYSTLNNDYTFKIEIKDSLLTIDYGNIIDKLEPFSKRLFRVCNSNVYYNFTVNEKNEIKGIEVLFNGRAFEYLKK